MDDYEDQRFAMLEAAHLAVRACADMEFARLGRRVIAQLQRTRASGIFGDAWRAKSSWDEYCYEVQRGPSALEGAFEQHVGCFIAAVIQSMRKPALVLLTVAAACELCDDDAEAELIGSAWEEGLVQVIGDRVKRISMDRNLERIGFVERV